MLPAGVRVAAQSFSSENITSTLSTELAKGSRNMTAKTPLNRRPLKSRGTRWAGMAARLLIRFRVKPNHISIASMVFALGAGFCFGASAMRPSSSAWLLMMAAVLIQMRLLCNLFDGMVAIEGGFKTKSGEIFNELPDRFADAFVLIGAGYAAPRLEWMPLAGWAAAVLALITAYVRALGAAAGAQQQFCGPMAKPHRMAVMTAAAVIGAFLHWCRVDFPIVGYVLVAVVLGCLVTICRRTARIIRELESP
jgi:phosphatidylglycerophosphate synthase